MADGTQPYRPNRQPHPPEALLERQRLSRELYGWEHEFTLAHRGDAAPPEIAQALENLTETGAEIVRLVREFERRFTHSLAASPRFRLNTAYLADLLADTLADGLTADAARVLTAAVKRDCA